MVILREYIVYRRSPHGERGLKCVDIADTEALEASLPSRGAWIEIHRSCCHPRRLESLPSRGAWIEIINPVLLAQSSTVAPLTGSVD